MHFRLILYIFFIVIIFNGCYKSTEWEDIDSDYSPVLNIIGIVSLDENIESFIRVYRTTELTETSMMYTGAVDTNYWYDSYQDTIYTWLDSTYAPYAVIDSAVVKISTESDEFIFEFDSGTLQYKNDAFIPRQNIQYTLNVDVDGFDSITGELITPYIPEIDTSLNDTLPSNSTYTIKWNNNQSESEYGLLKGDISESFIACGGEFHDLIEFSSNEITIFPQWCNSEQIGVGDIDNEYGLKSIDECLCSEYRSWDQNSENCLCLDQDIENLEDNNESLEDFGGCELAINQFGCDYVSDDGFSLFYYCPVMCGGCEYISNLSNYQCNEDIATNCPNACGVCDENNLEPNINRNWEQFNIDKYVESEIDFLQTDYGYCGDGNPDYEEIMIRLIAMDQNYYEYFERESFKDFSNFLFETGGTSGNAIGISGGFGVFGSFASTYILRTISP